MKTKQIPAIVMLLGGLVYCIIGFKQQLPSQTFLKQLLLILITFYIIGGIAKAVLDPFFKEEAKEDGENALETESDESDGEIPEEAENNTEGQEQTEESQKTAGDV